MINGYNAYNMYKEQSVNTMTPSEMILTLYDEAVKRINRGKLAKQNGDFAFFEKEVDRAIEIINYLDVNLDNKYEVSGNLHSLYEYMIYNLKRAKIGRKDEPLDEIIPFIKELRETFSQASKIAAKQ